MMTSSLLKTIKDNNGKDGIWFAGQYVGFPSLETGAYSGYKAALGITKTKDHYLLDKLKYFETRTKIRFYSIMIAIIIIIFIIFAIILKKI